MWQSLIWLSLINGFIAFLLFILPLIDPAEIQGADNPPPDIMGLTLYFTFAVLAGSIGMIILAQDEVIQEKQSGTAAWILSKPVSRPAFILTKLLSNGIGGLIFIVTLPAVVTASEIYLAARYGIAILPYLMGMGVVLLTLCFYLSLTLMLGALFEQRGPVLGASFGIMFGGLIAAQYAPQVRYFLPVSMDEIALALSLGQALPAVALSQLIATAAWTILFIAVALWRFERLEL
ncbi:MAG: ABC transporter permease subunit [Anaerolineales bacterium]|nr:ABC transporter permease subunit [Anaerolineales bacterium]